MKGETRRRVVVAMSGGVDSSVAAALLHRQGLEVIGLSMRLFTYEKEATHGCCTPEDLYDARRVADQLGIPHYVSDFEERFEKAVVDNFVQSYQKGETPNPCARCNQDVKFSTLMKKAMELGADLLATGHYARKTFDGIRYRLLRGVDPSRDQSYFLFGLTQEELRRSIFPLGSLHKTEIRKIAKEENLPVADKPDSQEICFVPDDYVSFLEKRVSEKDRRPGALRNEEGEVLAKHSGIHQFTVGQRKGLGLPTSKKHYVLAIRPDGDVVVGPNKSLFKSTFEVRQTTWVDQPLREGATVLAQIRSQFLPQPAKVNRSNDGKLSVTFNKPQRAITSGQAAVFYQGDELIGGGWINRVSGD